MNRAIPIIFVLLIVSACSTVVNEQHTGKASKYTLQNGMIVLLKENPETGMVALDLFIKKGITSDLDKTGIGQFTNRMLLAGTKTRNREQITSEIENLGGSITARTYAEYSEIVIEIPSESTSTALEILSDVALNPAFNEEEIERERTLILGEIAAKADNPNIVSDELFMETIYLGHPYQNPIDGTSETISLMTKEDLVEHYNNWYIPSNMIFSIAGNIKKEKIVNLVDAVFGKIRKQGYTEQIPEPKKHENILVNEKAMVLESFYIHQGYRTVPASHPDFIALRLANGVLGSGSGSRLFYNLRDIKGLAYTVYSIAPSIRTTGFVKISMITRPDKLNESLKGINEQVEKIRGEKVPEEELNLVKRKMKGFFALDHQKTVDQANYLGVYEMQGLGFEFDEQYPLILDSVSSSDVKRVASQYLVNPQTAIVGPFGQ